MWPILSWLGSNLIAVANFAITWWRYQKETFSALLALCAGNSSVTTWINGWANNREANDLRRHRAHWNVTEITSCTACELFLPPLSTHPGNITAASYARSRIIKGARVTQTHWSRSHLKLYLNQWFYKQRLNYCATSVSTGVSSFTAL